MDLSSKKDLTNKYMHMTNNAIQELGPKYNLYEKGNIIDIPRMQQILKADHKNLDFEAQIWPQICEGVRVSTLACAHLLNPNQRHFCFEVFGYDFMIDADGKVWIIEVNTNPSFSESNNVVKEIIERMIGSRLLTQTTASSSPSTKSSSPEESNPQTLTKSRLSLGLPHK